ncbi:hypothetical protein KPL74_09735 [Bacillus sp. NP157]|nr:hypothetical protein KPL74_09735 [Bacillus sp. NP157]
MDVIGEKLRTGKDDRQHRSPSQHPVFPAGELVDLLPGGIGDVLDMLQLRLHARHGPINLDEHVQAHVTTHAEVTAVGAEAVS